MAADEQAIESVVYPAEDELLDTTDSLRARETVPGVLGEAIIADVRNHEGNWVFELELPNTQTETLTFSDTPVSQTDTLYAFLSAAGVRGGQATDAERKRIPVALTKTGWKPIFPKRNTRVEMRAFKNVIWATKKNLTHIKPVSDENWDYLLTLKPTLRKLWVYGHILFLVLFFLVFGVLMFRFAYVFTILFLVGFLYWAREGLRNLTRFFDTPIWPTE